MALTETLVVHSSRFTRLLPILLCTLGAFCWSHVYADEVLRESVKLPHMTYLGTSEAFYPAVALKNALQGLVLIAFRIGANGMPTDVAIIDSEPDHTFDAATLNYLTHHSHFAVPADWMQKAESTHFFRIVFEYKLRFCTQDSHCSAEEEHDSDESAWTDGWVKIAAQRLREPSMRN